jgi:hypothetical protein
MRYSVDVIESADIVGRNELTGAERWDDVLIGRRSDASLDLSRRLPEKGRALDAYLGELHRRSAAAEERGRRAVARADWLLRGPRVAR